MRLVETSGGPLHYVTCCQCGTRVWAGGQQRTFNPDGHTTSYADLDGSPFTAYYCPCCAALIQARSQL